MTAKAEQRTKALQARIQELEARLAHADKTVQALRDVGLALGSTLDLDQLLALILNKITELLDADRATLYLLDEQRQRLLSRIIIGEEARAIELPVGAGIAGHVAKMGRTVRVKDAYRDRRFQRDWDEVTGYRTRSILAAPMKNHVGRTIGVIQVLNKHGEGEFSVHDEELLSALATQAAVSIDNSRLFLSVIQKNTQLVETKEQLEHRVSDLKLLFDLESAMGRATTMEDLARAVITEAGRACEARAGGMLVDEIEGGLFLYFFDLTAFDGGSAPPRAPALGDEPEGVVGGAAPRPAVKRIAMRRGEGVVGRAMVNNEAVCFSREGGGEEPDDTLVSPRLAQLVGAELRTAIAVPLEGEDAVPIGSMALYNSRHPHGFSKDDRALLRLVSANASTALRLFRSRLEREQSERLTTIGRLLSGVMHDMRTPLTVISGYVQLMASAPDAATREDHARLILKQFDVISAMQREVLEFARGERSILVRKVYLTKFFGDIEKQLAHELAGTGVSLSLELEDRGTARFDEAKMTRLLHNLVRNAVEAMRPGGGTVTIRAYRDEGDLAICVADTGKGIPKEIQGRLFQSFVTSGKRGGTGLGLAIVKKIVDEHAGTITVASSDKGAKFTIRLPQESAPSRSAGTAGGQPQLASTDGGSATKAGASVAPVVHEGISRRRPAGSAPSVTPVNERGRRSSSNGSDA
ncbi:GAF domain-containing protein [Sorangium atrum]|uniref:histidine kinase n=1 Tax=Sorangium atrum TaxID=2995308 RepID=A0ABT5CC37_9BACT|nr:GAF domain-containing protein [Sorangium aterium]MDC0684001.1 GAF domain-containing protein [Sorangium aterium]